MKWRNRRRSGNIEDRRGQSRSALPGKTGGIGMVVVVLAALYFGIDPSIIINQMGGPGSSSAPGADRSYQPSAAEQQLAEFTAVVLADTEDIWHEIFRNQIGARYQEPKLVLFSGAVQSACGAAQSAMGPFYCPADQKVYIDLSFYRDLKQRHNAPGDFAQAYVVAHEVGHHVQTITGISQRVHQQKARVSKTQANQLSVRQELQADCFSGVWANRAQQKKQILERGDIAEALNAATSIGDDRLQQQAQGYVVPESFTHGTSEQRVRWFRIGFESGDIADCDTFSVSRL